MSLFLNPDELEELTDRYQPAAQARVLRTVKIAFMRHAGSLEPNLEALYQ